MDGRTAHQVSFSQKLFYGLGGVGDSIMGGIIFLLAMKIFNWEYGLSAGLVGVALLVPRLWDVVVAPFMGALSDNAQTRWGRRRPFIFVGAVVTGLLCMAMWSPPAGIGQTGLFLYLVILSVLFFTFYNVFCIPYTAMGFELASDYNERTSVMAFKLFFGNLGNLVLMSIVYKLCRVKFFGDTPIEAVRVVGLIYGLLIIVLGIIPAVFCHTHVVPPPTTTPKKDRLFRMIAASFINWPYMILTFSGMLLIVGIYLVSQLGLFLSMSYVFQGDKDRQANFDVISGICFGIAGVVSSMFAPAITRCFGKLKTVLGTLVVMILTFAGSWFYMTPTYPYLMIISGLLMSPAMTIFLVVTASMTVDTVDYDEQKTGARREGIFASVSTFVAKAGLAITLGISGLLVDLSGFRPELPMQSQGTILALRLMYALLPCIFLLVVFILLLRYPLTQGKITEIQEFLKNKNLQESEVA